MDLVWLMARNLFRFCAVVPLEIASALLAKLGGAPRYRIVEADDDIGYYLEEVADD